METNNQKITGLESKGFGILEATLDNGVKRTIEGTKYHTLEFPVYIDNIVAYVSRDGMLSGPSMINVQDIKTGEKKRVDAYWGIPVVGLRFRDAHTLQVEHAYKPIIIDTSGSISEGPLERKTTEIDLGKYF